jgi:hypothetical protein
MTVGYLVLPWWTVGLMIFHNCLQTNTVATRYGLGTVSQKCSKTTATVLQYASCLKIAHARCISRSPRLIIHYRHGTFVLLTPDSLNHMTHVMRLRTMLPTGLLTCLLTHMLPPVWAQASAPQAAASSAKPSSKPVAKVADKVVPKTSAKTALAAQPPTTLTAADLGSNPTRMQRCQVEISGMQGPARTRALRACLIDRTEGERLIARDCARQFRSLPAGQTVEKSTFQKQCAASALNVAHKDLPRRKPAAPKVMEDGSTPSNSNSGVMPVSASSAKPAPQPAPQPASKPVVAPAAVSADNAR